MVVLDDFVKLLGKSGGFFVGQIKVHDRDIGLRSPGAKPRRLSKIGPLWRSASYRRIIHDNRGRGSHRAGDDIQQGGG